MGLLFGHGPEHVAVVLWLSPPEEVPALSQRTHLLEVDPRRDELVAPRRRLREHLALRVDDAGAGDQLDAVLHARLGDADHEAEVRVRPGAHAELVEIERQRRDRRVVADQDDLGALQRERAIALGIAAVLAERDADFRADRIEDAIARVAVGEVVGLVDLGKAVDGLRARQVDLAERAAQTPVAVGEEGGVEVLAVCLLAEADVHGHARLGGATKQGLESLRRYLGLEELIEVGADFLGEVGRQRHLRIDDQLHAIARRRFEEGEHPLDDRLAGCPLLIGTHLGGGNFQVAWHPSLLSGGAGPAVPAFPGLSLHADTALSNTRQATSARDVSNRPASGRGVSNLRADCLTTRLPEWQMTYSGGSDHAQNDCARSGRGPLRRHGGAGRGGRGGRDQHRARPRLVRRVQFTLRRAVLLSAIHLRRAGAGLLLSGVPDVSGGCGASLLSDRLRSDAGARAAILERRAISPRALRAARRRRQHGLSVGLDPESASAARGAAASAPVARRY